MTRRLLPILVLLSALALLVSIVGGVRHDYGDYLRQWTLVLDGADPWSTNNAYGPLHNLFAWLVPVHPLAPKIGMAASLLIANGLLVLRLGARPSAQWRTLYLLAFGLNLLVLISAYWFGNNDGFVAALLLGAVLARLDNRLLLAGLFLGLATLEKFYPALLIPFFALDARRIEPRLLLSAFGTIALGIALAVLAWGSAWFEAIAYGVSRDATILSILRPIVTFGRSIGMGDTVDLLVRFNGPTVILVWLICIAAVWLRRDSWLTGACWGFFAVLLTYKVGNQQFWVSWLALVAALPLLHTVEADRLARLSLPYAVFLSLFQLGFTLLQPQYFQGQWLWVNEIVGIPSFALGLWMLWSWLSPAPRPRL